MAHSAIRFSTLFAAVLAAGAMPARGATKPVLSVCADPNNLPYSNEQRQGFENRIAALVARDMQAELSYFWFAEHRSFFRRTVLDRLCDVVVSVPAGLPILATTKPFFTSSYVAVTRRADPHHFVSFDDAWLREARIGLQLVGAEGATTPPATALARRGINRHITWLPMWDEDKVRNPQGRIIDAVADGKIDVAFVWGPFAGYFARPYGAALRIEPITADPGAPEQSFVFAMAMGVRKDDLALRDRLQIAIDRHAAEIAAILRDDGVPTVPLAPVRPLPVTASPTH